MQTPLLAGATTEIVCSQFKKKQFVCYYVFYMENNYAHIMHFFVKETKSYIPYQSTTGMHQKPESHTRTDLLQQNNSTDVTSLFSL